LKKGSRGQGEIVGSRNEPKIEEGSPGGSGNAEKKRIKKEFREKGETQPHVKNKESSTKGGKSK